MTDKSGFYNLNMVDWTVDDCEWLYSCIRVTARYQRDATATCKGCGYHGVMSVKDRRKKDVTDVPFAAAIVEISIQRARLECPECGKSAGCQDLPDIVESRSFTKRCIKMMEDEAFGQSAEKVAAMFGVSDWTTRATLKTVGDKIERGRKIAAPRILGIDEKWISGSYRPVFVDLSSEGSPILDILSDWSLITVENFLRDLRGNWRIEFVAVDGRDVYRQAVRNVLGDRVTIVMDRWHVGKSFVGLRHKATTEAAARRLDAIWKLATRKEADAAFAKWEASLSPALRKDFSTLLGWLGSRRDDILAWWETGVTNAGTEARNRQIQEIISASRGGSFEMIRARSLYADLRPHRDLLQCEKCRGFFRDEQREIQVLNLEEQPNGHITMTFACEECVPIPQPQEVDTSPIWLSEAGWGPEPGTQEESDRYDAALPGLLEALDAYLADRRARSSPSAAL
ncbi:transposase [Beijerinckia sp. L45]|uniref:transposase n=1 Tax=Beijerinckia sp. L45 TaxID=1641855 RepID=UPI00131ECF2B|nr:transposase [Beijerinckia sp. L45]